jgi:hypothetical protein
MRLATGIYELHQRASSGTTLHGENSHACNVPLLGYTFGRQRATRRVIGTISHRATLDAATGSTGPGHESDWTEILPRNLS